MRPEDPFTPTTSSRPAPSGLKGKTRVHAWVWPASLACLVATTTLAVAYFGSVWLVPVYLVLMLLILGVPGGKREPARASVNGPRRDAMADTRTLANESVATTATTTRFGSDPNPTSTAVTELDPVPGDDPATLALKPLKKGRSRSRKPKPIAVSQETTDVSETIPEPLVTWIRVGPGKFVRADAVVNIPEYESARAIPDPELTNDLPAEPVPEPADAPDAGDVGSETEGEPARLVATDEVDAERFEERHALEVHDEVSTRDNGIAPDALAEPVAEFPEHVVELENVEAETVPSVEPEPAAVAVTEPSPDAPPAPSELCEDWESSTPTPEIENVPGGVGAPVPRRDRPGSTWTPTAPWRGLTRGRIPALAITASASRVSPGNVRPIHPARVRTGIRRSPRRGRGPGRTRPADRNHPPRSPPERTNVRERRPVLHRSPITPKGAESGQ